jgi:hypothetical protein
MNQRAANVDCETKQPEHDQDDYYGPEHGYAFPLSWFKHRIPTKFREAIKQKRDHQGSDELRFG